VVCLVAETPIDRTRSVSSEDPYIYVSIDVDYNMGTHLKTKVMNLHVFG